MSTGPMIEVSNLEVTFGSGASAVRAVRGVSFGVARGETFGIVGESGSGKSIVLRAIAGLNPAWSGRIAVDDRALGRRRDRAFYRNLQMVFQDPYGSLHPRHTVNDILKEPLVIHGFDRIESRILAALDVSVQAEILNLLGRLQREHGLTFVLVSHDLAIIAHTCDRLAVMNAGRIVEETSVDHLRRADPEHPYTRQLLRASLGYDRAAAAEFVTYE